MLWQEHGINVTGLESDHVCYRVESVEKYTQLKDDFIAQGHELLVEGMIGGRPISTLKLKEPIRVQINSKVLLSKSSNEDDNNDENNATKIEFVVSCVELPQPKPGRPYDEMLEHVEFVIGYLYIHMCVFVT